MCVIDTLSGVSRLLYGKMEDTSRFLGGGLARASCCDTVFRDCHGTVGNKSGRRSTTARGCPGDWSNGKTELATTHAEARKKPILQKDGDPTGSGCLHTCATVSIQLPVLLLHLALPIRPYTIRQLAFCAMSSSTSTSAMFLPSSK